MYKVIIAMLSCWMATIAVASPLLSADDLSEGAQTNKIGGVTVKLLVKQVGNVPTMKIRIDEIIATNGNVVVTGSFFGIQGHDMIIAPMFLESVFAGTILSVEGSKDRFRLVADNELAMVDYEIWDQVFANSKLFVCHDGETKFCFSYSGFASDAEEYGSKIEMNRTKKFKALTQVKYHTRRFVGVRFKGRKYYPWDKDAFSMVNVDGDGCCKITIQ